MRCIARRGTGVGGVSRLGFVAPALLPAALACSDPEETDELPNQVVLELQVAPGVSLDSVSWSVSNAGTGFSRSGSVDVSASNRLRFQVGGLPAGSGYAIELEAASTDGSLACFGTQSFEVAPDAVTSVPVELKCAAASADSGAIAVTGTVQLCADIQGIDVAPLEASVGSEVALFAAASAGSTGPTFAWTASAGSFDDATSATPIFTCPATPGEATLTLTVSPGAPSCDTRTSQSVVVTCERLEPTFTNVYANVLAQRCVSCHRPGGSGVNAGRLDLSTPAVAYASLVGVAAQGTGAGASGVTCASVSPPLVRVQPDEAANSLLFAKVNSKLFGNLPPCGSPMPLPGSASPLTAAQVALVGAWIDSGALDD